MDRKSSADLLTQSAARTGCHRKFCLWSFGLVIAFAFVNVGDHSSLRAENQKPAHVADVPLPSKVNFARDIRPILAAHCWSCHGADEAARKADLRLDLRDSAVRVRKTEPAAITPGKPEASPLVERVESSDESQIMPPPEAKKPLNDLQKRLLRAWVAQGAEYSRHWAFEPIQRPQPPSPRLRERARNPIDLFVLQRLEQLKLVPAAEGPREVWLRRVTLDLTGLPPSLDERERFLADASQDAYEKVVDRLLASPRYAERMAQHWLDVARYADTNGYNNDEERTMWPWRDWVIDAFRRNLPYDRFLTEQLAGDLLPGATLSQKVATAFNRNHVLTTEGGIIDEEYRVEYVADRVHTTATVFLGLSFQCARCHDHKFDPVTQRDYYQFFAYFNQQPDRPLAYSREEPAPPFIKVPSSRQQTELAGISRKIADLQQQLQQRAQGAETRAAAWEAKLAPGERQELARSSAVLYLPLDEKSGTRVNDLVDTHGTGTLHGKVDWTAGKVGGALTLDGQNFVDLGHRGAFDSRDKFSLSAWVYVALDQPSTILSKMDEGLGSRGYDVMLENRRVACHLVDHWPDNAIKVVCREPIRRNDWHHVVVSYDGSRQGTGVKIYVDGKPQVVDVSRDTLKGTLLNDKPLHVGRREWSAGFQGCLDDVALYAAVLSPEEAVNLASGQAVNRLASLLAVAPAERSASQKADLTRLYLERIDAEYRTPLAELWGQQQRREEFEKTIPGLMVMQDLAQPRPTHLLRRGQYDQPAEVVKAGVPAFLPSLPTGGVTNRLGLAQWLVRPDHPLTARVAVNRWWEMYFGSGLVETSEDFGVTGSLPSHPELLDWLAAELIRTHWDVKAMQKLIVLSNTYRQSSQATAENRLHDPQNRWLSRGPRYRLPAEVVRDNALAISGLLVEKIGGPSVKPYQPEGLWEEVSVERRYTYVPDPGDGLYRRTMYTFWKRTCPPPGLSTFDAPSRETCTIRRARTNTPLQALVLLNDPTYVEAARKMAERLFELPGATASSRLERAFLLAVSRKPRPDEERVLLTLREQARTKFALDRTSAAKLLAVGRSSHNATLNEADLAAWTVVCTTLLNLDETISKE